MTEVSPEVLVGAPPGQVPIDILVPTHNHLELTIKCIESIYAYTRIPFHLILTDQQLARNEDDLTPLYLRQLQKIKDNITLLSVPIKSGNHFFNLALEHCKTPYLATVMNSITVEPDWENVALQLMANDPKIGIIGFKCLFPWGLIESAGIQMAGYTPTDIGRDLPGHRLASVYECPAVQWAFALLRVEAIKGKLDEDLFNAWRGWDDIDNSFVIRKAGWKIVYDGLGVGYHFPRASRGDNSEVAHVENLKTGPVLYKRHGFWNQFKEANPNALELVEEKDGKLVKKDLSGITARLVPA